MIKNFFKIEVLAFAYTFGFVEIANAQEILAKSLFYKISNLWHVGLALIIIVALTPLFQAFEAHVVNVKAQPVLIEAPLITQGDQDPNRAFIVEQDNDATHVYFTFGPGPEPESVIDPVCGDTNGGPKSEVYSVDISADTLIKAIGCDGSDSTAHNSIITTKFFTKEVASPEPLQIDEPSETLTEPEALEEEPKEEPTGPVEEIVPPPEPESPPVDEVELTEEPSGETTE